MLQLDTLPQAWKNYDLVVTASMLEYVPRSILPAAFRALRGRLHARGTLLLFITRNNALMRPLIERRWAANLYTRLRRFGLTPGPEAAGLAEPGTDS